MANSKISALTAATTPVAGTEVLPIVQSGATVQVSINAATGITRPFTANGVPYASSTTALTTGSGLTFDGTNLATTGTSSATKLIPTGGTATGNGMYLPAANTLAFSTNGGERARIFAAGGLSIGTTTAAPVGGIAVTPSAGVASLDSSNATVTLAAAGTQTFPTSSGMLLVTSYTTGATYLYICGGGATAQVSSVGASIGTFTFNGTSYVFTNTTAVSQQYGFMFFRSRNSA